MFVIDRVVEILESLHVNEEAIQAVSAALENGAELIETSAFMTSEPLRPTAFGASDRGSDLGFHHDKARAVVVDTLDAFMDDLVGFAEGVSRAVSLVVDADETTRADLTVQRQAVEILADHTGTHSSGRADGERR
ncbi:hypothetical protein [Nocardioides lijunqiniae]|uniref:hypothetical protein n=1 Tax=Nocardioides lijunqiniae TaxID=2760832 RepID=UPI0018776C37|nr:hypothetical protein [Nocardioides lijunqiniae]